MLEILKEKYDVIRKIGRGGMAEIYLARDKSSNKEVALKLLHPEKKNHEADRKRFLSEIKLTKRIDSPYVVKVFDYRWDDEIQYIAMEYIEGEILKNYIARRTKLTVDEAVEFSKQLALGFEEIHRAGIVHRDIKSSNIMISDHGQVKIIDFGIAITDESERLTKTDNVIGSVQYIAPEILDQKPITHKSDIYALGILMFEMLTGSVPFSGKDAIETALQHKRSSVPHVNKIFDSIPQSVTNVVIRATAKDASKRYSSMYEVYKDVSTSLNSERIYEPVVNLDKKEKMTFKRLMNSKGMLIGIISAILLILIVVIVILAIEVI